MTYREAFTHAQKVLSDGQIPDAGTDAWYLMEYVCGFDRTHYLLWMNHQMPPEQQTSYEALVRRRLLHIPLQHLTGRADFMGLSFRVDQRVLIPRQETELLVEEALGCLERMRRDQVPSGEEVPQVLDLCTGSGCIAVSIRKLGKPVLVTASDISAEALELAEENAVLADVPVNFVQSDLFAGITRRFDLIVSNPPYIPTEEIGTLMEEVRAHDPLLALDGGADGLDCYRVIAREAGKHLFPGGELLLEIGADQADAVRMLLEEAGFLQVRVQQDLAGRDRVVYGKWPVCVCTGSSEE